MATRRKRCRRHPDRRWSEIPADLLSLILRRLTVRDFIRSGAVCASWRSAVLERRCSPAPEPPWVIICRNRDGVAGGGVIRLPKRKLEKMDIPDPVRSYCLLGSSNGWVGLQYREFVRLFHPLTGAVIRLPPLTTIPGVEAINDDKGKVTGLDFSSSGGGVGVKRLIFKTSGPPFMSKICLVPPAGAETSATIAGVCGILAVCLYMKRLVFVRPGDSAWSFVGMPSPVVDDIVHVTRFRGSLCAVDTEGRVAAWDPRDAADATPQFRRVIISSGPPYDGEFYPRYLVEAHGELLQVKRHLVYMSGQHGGGDGAGGGAEGRGWYRTTKASIFRLEEDSGEGKRWTPVRSLGGLSLFLGRTSSAAFSSNDFPWLEKNCIYFTDQFAVDDFPQGCDDRGVYHLRSQTMRLFKPFRCHRTWFNGIWYIPML